MPAYDANLFNPPAPLARITLRDQKNATMVSDVAMLIDTGADVTLVPQVAVNQLGVTVDPSQSYELMGFDGGISVVQAVELDLVFLKRIFRGRILIIDQEVGILGRDILNHVSVVLDGPRLSWDEQRSSQT
jgi:predicted aspartyl protease